MGRRQTGIAKFKRADRTTGKHVTRRLIFHVGYLIYPLAKGFDFTRRTSAFIGGYQ
jgi:hypothetical protein